MAMSEKELLTRLECDHVERAEYLAQESEAETRKKNFVDLSLKKLEALEYDTWKRVMHIDESLDTVRSRINEMYFFDEREMSSTKKVEMVAELLDYERRLVAARGKLTDSVLRKITDREKAMLRADGVRKGLFEADGEEE